MQDAARDPTVLPLLQYALCELYEQRAELVTFPSRDALPKILPLLVTVDVAGEQSTVRRRTPLPERTDPLTAQQELTDSLIAARLQTTDRQGDVPVASLAHESLLRRWDRIATWITSNFDCYTRAVARRSLENCPLASHFTLRTPDAIIRPTNGYDEQNLIQPLVKI